MWESNLAPLLGKHRTSLFKAVCLPLPHLSAWTKHIRDALKLELCVYNIAQPSYPNKLEHMKVGVKSSRYPVPFPFMLFGHSKNLGQQDMEKPNKQSKHIRFHRELAKETTLDLSHPS